MKILKQLDRKDLTHAVWAAEFVRALGGTGQSHLAKEPVALHYLAKRAADSADHAVEMLRLLSDIEFRLATPEELDRCFMTWEKFVACCHLKELTDADGYGELATDDHHVSNIRLHPSDVLASYVRPNWATHVAWYNK